MFVLHKQGGLNLSVFLGETKFFLIKCAFQGCSQIIWKESKWLMYLMLGAHSRTYFCLSGGLMLCVVQ